MIKLRIIREPVAECCSTRGTSAEAISSTPFTASIASLVGLQYVIVALACGIIFALLGSLLLYETIRFAAMLLHVAL
jgi:hypothetical protein